MNRGKIAAKNSDFEVEELLRAAHEDLLLNLQIDTHPISSSSSSSTALDSYPDLTRRFEALRARSSPPSPPTNPPPPERKRVVSDANVEDLLRATEDDLLLKLRVGVDSFSDLDRRFEALKGRPSDNKEGASAGGGEEWDDLSARFAALKGNVGPDRTSGRPFAGVNDGAARGGVGGDREEGEGWEAEVEKVMQWAMDAARLDPSVDDDDEGVRGS